MCVLLCYGNAHPFHTATMCVRVLWRGRIWNVAALGSGYATHRMSRVAMDSQVRRVMVNCWMAKSFRRLCDADPSLLHTNFFVVGLYNTHGRFIIPLF